MDNNELDKILKEKLKGKIQMPQEMQEKIKQKVEQEKSNYKKSKNIKYNKTIIPSMILYQPKTLKSCFLI